MLPSDPITAVADAVAVIVDDIAKPLLSTDLTQAHDNDFKNLCQRINDAFALPEPDRARALGALAARLCIDNGYPVASGLSEDISVPVGYLDALLTIAAAKERDDAKAGDLLHALTAK